MRVKKIEQKPAFKPIKLEIVLESEKEAKAFRGIFNSAAMEDYFVHYEIDSEAIRSQIHEYYQNDYAGMLTDYIKKGGHF